MFRQWSDGAPGICRERRAGGVGLVKLHRASSAKSCQEVASMPECPLTRGDDMQAIEPFIFFLFGNRR